MGKKTGKPVLTSIMLFGAIALAGTGSLFVSFSTSSCSKDDKIINYSGSLDGHDWKGYISGGWIHNQDYFINNNDKTVTYKGGTKKLYMAKNLVIPEKITDEVMGIKDYDLVIGESAFEGCEDIGGKLSFSGNIKVTGESAFQGCSGIEKVDLCNIKEIGWDCFESCKKINNINLRNVVSIDGGAFSECEGLKGKLIIPNTVVVIGRQAFMGTNFSTQDDVLYSSDKRWCLGFISNTAWPIHHDLCIDDGAIFVGDGAFQQAYGLTGTITIPTTVLNIGTMAFYECDINNIEFKRAISPLSLIGKNAFDGLRDSGDNKIYIPSNTTEAYTVVLQNTGIPNANWSIEER